MTPSPSAWCDREKLARWFMDSADNVDHADGLALADELLASGLIERKPTYEEMLREAGLGATSSTEDIAFIWDTMIDAASPGDE